MLQRSTGLNSCSEWLELNRRGLRPVGVPSSPSAIYQEWISFPNFLGYVSRHVNQRRSVQEWVLCAETISDKNNGILPNHAALERAGGLSGLNACMNKHPEAFAHIVQDKKHKTIAEIVRLAELLAESNNGLLPHSRWLQNNGHRRIVRAKKLDPDAFQHLQQEIKNHFYPMEYYVKLAERLAKENNGTLINPRKIELTHNTLYHKMTQCPSLFSHIPQKKKNILTLKDYVLIAENLAKEFGGKLPSQRVLTKINSGLAKRISQHRDEFSHILQLRKSGRTLEENVKKAEDIAKENGGILHNPLKLKKMGFGGIPQMMRKNAKAFKHIKTELTLKLRERLGLTSK